MKEWAIYFFGNFFSKKYATESQERKLGNGILAFLLAIILMYVAFCNMSVASFPSHYDKSEDFKAYYHGLFDGTALKMQLSDGKMAWVGENDHVINSFTNEDDREQYAKDGYNVIIDLRPCAELYNDCYVEYVSDYDGKAISEEDFETLNDAKKEEYTAKLHMTDKTIVFTPELVAQYVTYITENGDDTAKESLSALLTNGVASESNYGKVYELYYKTRYSAFGSGFTTVPTMRNYYVSTYLATDSDGKSVYSDYVILLQDIAFASWKTDAGQQFSVTGYYGNEKITVSDGEGADELILNLFESNTAALNVNYLLYTVQAVLTLIFVWILLPMLASIIGFIAKNATLSNYGGMCKTMGAFWLGSTIPALIFVVVGSFFLSQTYVFYLGWGVLLATLLVRTVIHYVTVMVEQRRTISEEDNENDEQD